MLFLLAQKSLLKYRVQELQGQADKKIKLLQQAVPPAYNLLLRRVQSRTVICVPVAGGVRAGVLARVGTVPRVVGHVSIRLPQALLPVFLPVHTVTFLSTYIYL